uniref:Rho termination factor-like N-terminal domain-containing protein n=1 Tax=viral metagenome TaxID=1070528 RepID=A0A6C0K8X5_9ZZZZ
MSHSQTQLELVNRITESKFWSGTRNDTLELLAEYTGRPLPGKKATKKIKDKAPTTKKNKKMGLDSKTMPQLKALCKERGITGYSKMKKDGLLDLINKNAAVTSAPAVVPAEVPNVPGRTRCDSVVSDTDDDAHEPDSEDDELNDSEIPPKDNDILWGDFPGDEESEDFSRPPPSTEIIENNLVAEDYD